MAQARAATAGSYDDAAAGPMKRVSWGAIFAGVVIVLIVQVLLSMLGVGVGAATVDITEGQSPAATTIGIGAGLWWVIASLLSVAAGAFVAGRLAGMPQRMDGALHGLIVWGLSALVVFWLMTTAMGAVLGGAFSALSTITQQAGQAVYQTGQAAATAARSDMQLPGPLGQIQSRIEAQIDQALNQANQQLREAMNNPQVRESVRNLVTAAQDGLSQSERDRAIEVIVENTDLTRQEVEQQIEQLRQTYQTIVQEARQAAEAAANTLAQAAIWAFIALVIGAVVGAAAGAFGSPRDPYSRGYH